MKLLLTTIFASGISCLSFISLAAEEAAPSSKEFEEVRAILAQNCLECHNGTKKVHLVTLTLYVDVKAGWTPCILAIS